MSLYSKSSDVAALAAEMRRWADDPETGIILASMLRSAAGELRQVAFLPENVRALLAAACDLQDELPDWQVELDATQAVVAESGDRRMVYIGPADADWSLWTWSVTSHLEGGFAQLGRGSASSSTSAVAAAVATVRSPSGE